jgi:predicted LPLAT superfamily acyltransferase
VPVGDSNRVCAAEFFGRAAHFPIGPYVLATLLQCPVYLLHCYRANDEYQLGMERFADEIRPSRSGRNAAYQQHAQRFATALEAQVVRAPLQWFNFYDFWSNEGATTTAPASQT